MRKNLRKIANPKFSLGDTVKTPRGSGNVKYVFAVSKYKNKQTTYVVKLPAIRLGLVFNEEELSPVCNEKVRGVKFPFKETVI